MKIFILEAVSGTTYIKVLEGKEQVASWSAKNEAEVYKRVKTAQREYPEAEVMWPYDMRALDIIAWLKAHTLISLNALEKLCDLPQSTLSVAISGKRALPGKHIAKLVEALAAYGYT